MVLFVFSTKTTTTQNERLKADFAAQTDRIANMHTSVLTQTQTMRAMTEVTDGRLGVWRDRGKREASGKTGTPGSRLPLVAVTGHEPPAPHPPTWLVVSPPNFFL